MSYLSKLSSRVEAVLRGGHFGVKTSLLLGADSCSWSRAINTGSFIRSVALNSAAARLYSSKGSKSAETPKRTGSKTKAKPKTDMSKDIKEEKKMKKKTGKEDGAFYVVRRGDVIGLYASLDDCQAQVGSSICDSPVSVFKGYNLPKNTEEYLATRGLKNPIFTIHSGDLKEDIFGPLVQFSLADPTVAAGDASKKRSQEEAGIQTEVFRSISTASDLHQMHAKLSQHDILSSSNYKSCILKFDGACKGNPGKAGAGAVLLAADNSLICTLREGCGLTTNNVAEYRALILGLKRALERGYNRISVQGDSKLVCMQVLGLWKIKDTGLAELHKEVIELKNQFIYFQIFHVLRVLNSEADAVANRAVTLYSGEAVEETPD